MASPRTILILATAIMAATAAKGGKSRKKPTPSPTPKPPDAQVVGAVAALNAERVRTHLGTVVLDPALTHAAQLHAEYLAKNHGKPETTGHAGETQELASLPGYTPEGAQAAAHADVSVGRPPTQAVGEWMSSLYHRAPILVPALKKVGVGYATSPDGPVSVLAFDGNPDTLEGHPVACPADNQGGVPLELEEDDPNPLPQGAPPAGFPITLSFGPGGINNVQAELLDSAGRDVPSYLSFPEHPASATPQPGVVCLIPRRRLRPGARYQVAFAIIPDVWSGVQKNFRWQFRTATPAPVDASDPKALEQAGARLVRFTGIVDQVGELPDGGRTLSLSAGKQKLTLKVDREAWPAFVGGGIEDLAYYQGWRVEVSGVVRPKNEVRLASPEEIKRLEDTTPVVSIDSPELGRSVSQVVRLKAKVEQISSVAGNVVLGLGEWDGKPITAVISPLTWQQLGVPPDQMSGRTVTARGVLVEGSSLTIAIAHPDQLQLEATE